MLVDEQLLLLLLVEDEQRRLEAQMVWIEWDCQCSSSAAGDQRSSRREFQPPTTMAAVVEAMAVVAVAMEIALENRQKFPQSSNRS